MKIFIIITLLTVSLSSLSQTKTGSGGVDDDDSPTIIIPTTGSSNSENRLNSFLAVFHYRDINCHNGGKFPLKEEEQNFVKIYLKLSLLRITFVADNSCSTLRSYLDCLSSPLIKKHLKNVLNDKDMSSYIAKRYSLKKEDAESMLLFFENIIIKECDECI